MGPTLNPFWEHIHNPKKSSWITNLGGILIEIETLPTTTTTSHPITTATASRRSARVTTTLDPEQQALVDEFFQGSADLDFRALVNSFTLPISEEDETLAPTTPVTTPTTRRTTIHRPKTKPTRKSTTRKPTTSATSRRQDLIEALNREQAQQIDEFFNEEFDLEITTTTTTESPVSFVKISDPPLFLWINIQIRSPAML